jgi:hypothetical protein
MNPKICSFQSGAFIHQRILAGMTLNSPCLSLPGPTPTPDPPLPPDPSPFPGPPLPEPAPTPTPPHPPDPSPFPGPPVTIQQRRKHNKPSNRLRCGNIKATIWQNVNEEGPFFATTFTRPFKDQSGAWRTGTSFGLNDLEALVPVAREAKAWISAHVLKR